MLAATLTRIEGIATILVGVMLAAVAAGFMDAEPRSLAGVSVMLAVSGLRKLAAKER